MAVRSRSRQLAAAAGLPAGCGRLGGGPGHGQVSGGGQQHHRDHAVRVGAQAAEEPEVLDQHPVGQAQHGEPDQDRADQPRPAGQERRAGNGERDHHEQVDREPVRLVEGGEGVDPGGQEPGLRGLGHGAGHAGQRAGLAVRDALPEPPPRPGLQDRHAEQERARAGRQQTPEPPGAPGPLGQRDQRAGHRVDQHRAGRAEQPGQAGGEDAAEGLAEHPHDQAPADADQPGQPGQRTAGRDDQPEADPHLNPHRGGAGLHRVVGPGGAADVHQVLHPARRASRRRLDHLGREPDRHLRLGLQDPVEDPYQAEPDAQQTPPGRLGRGGRRCLRRRACPGGGGARQSGPDGDPGQAHQAEDEQGDQPLVHQRRLERRDHGRVGEVESGAHPGHDRTSIISGSPPVSAGPEACRVGGCGPAGGDRRTGAAGCCWPPRTPRRPPSPPRRSAG